MAHLSKNFSEQTSSRQGSKSALWKLDHISMMRDSDGKLWTRVKSFSISTIIRFNWQSLGYIVHHCSSLYIIVHHCTSLYIILHIINIRCIFVQYCTSIYIIIDLCTSLYIFVHLCTSLYIYLHLRTSLYIYVHLCTSLWNSALHKSWWWSSHSIQMFRTDKPTIQNKRLGKLYELGIYE